MATDKILIHTADIQDKVTTHGYPATAFVFAVGNRDAAVHFIWYAGAITDVLFPNAPNGSIGTDTTNGDTYVKTLLPGSGDAGVWTQT